MYPKEKNQRKKNTHRKLHIFILIPKPILTNSDRSTYCKLNSSPSLTCHTNHHNLACTNFLSYFLSHPHQCLSIKQFINFSLPSLSTNFHPVNYIPSSINYVFFS